ncbi:MAG: D-glycero-alpha-D-manno-heptose-1,7-bisphosphate 7-phosphatase [Rhizomicrobium sp.]
MLGANGHLTAEGIWISGRPAHRERSVAGLLLDRDGVLVNEVNYLHRREDVVLMPGAICLLRWAAEREIPVAVVTNQAGIARGKFGWTQFEAVQDEIARQLSAEGICLDLILACPFHPEYTRGWCDAFAYWRKPGPGMLRRAAEMLNLDLKNSWLIGDNESDIASAKAAGMGASMHVMTGHGPRYRQNALALMDANFEVVAARDLREAQVLLQDRWAIKPR